MVERLRRSDDPALRECAEYERAEEVVAGLAWQYFKKEWQDVSACASVHRGRRCAQRARRVREGPLAGAAAAHTRACRPCSRAPRPRWPCAAAPPQVSTRGWDLHPEFRPRCIAKLRMLLDRQRLSAAPKKVGVSWLAGWLCVEGGVVGSAVWHTRGRAGSWAAEKQETRRDAPPRAASPSLTRVRCRAPSAALQRKVDKVRAAMGQLKKLAAAQEKLAVAEEAMGKLQRAVS